MFKKMILMLKIYWESNQDYLRILVDREISEMTRCNRVVEEI